MPQIIEDLLKWGYDVRASLTDLYPNPKSGPSSSDAFERRRPICIFESGSGTLLGLAAMLGVPLAVLALMPFARPFRWAHLLFTYLIPLTPLIVLWDGIVSMLRIYSPEQMQKLTEDLRAPDYFWEFGQVKVRGIPDGLPYLVGRPFLSTAPDSADPKSTLSMA